MKVEIVDEREPRVVRIRDVLPREKCQEIIDRCDAIGWEMDGKMSRYNDGARDYGVHPDARVVKEIWPHLTEEVEEMNIAFRPIFQEIGDLYRTEVARIARWLRAEPLRICRYPVGGFFTPHVDVWTSEGHDWRQLGVVIYLNDCEGGATHFDEGPLVVPEAGTAAVFPISKERKFVHQSLPCKTPKYMILSWLGSPNAASADRAPMVKRKK